MPHRLVFKQQFLADADAGRKRHTMRPWKEPYEFPMPWGGWRPGDLLNLAFGPYHRPTIRHARLERIDIVIPDGGRLVTRPPSALTRLTAAGIELRYEEVEAAGEAVVIWWRDYHVPHPGCCPASAAKGAKRATPD